MQRFKKHSIASRGVLALIKWYQYTVSPDHGVVSYGVQRRCRFYPTCSLYAATCIERRGLVRGGWRALLRVIRCNPLHPGGIDFVT